MKATSAKALWGWVYITMTTDGDSQAQKQQGNWTGLFRIRYPLRQLWEGGKVGGLALQVW
jgi:hypothetical protein